MKTITHILKMFKAHARINEDRTRWQGQNTDMAMLEVDNLFYKCPIYKTQAEAIENLAPNLEWADAHFMERISGEPLNPPPSHSKWLKDTEKFYMAGTDKFSHTYPERFWPKTLLQRGIRFETADLNTLIDLLKEDPNTRQAYLPIFFNEDLTCALEGERVPCTLGYYFYKKGDVLHCNYVIRSIDVIRHLHNDLYLTWLLLDYVCERLSYTSGSITLIAFNAHCFKNDEYTLDRRIKKNEAAIDNI